jgi:hypothetical protein
MTTVPTKTTSTTTTTSTTSAPIAATLEPSRQLLHGFAPETFAIETAAPRHRRWG